MSEKVCRGIVAENSPNYNNTWHVKDDLGTTAKSAAFVPHGKHEFWWREGYADGWYKHQPGIGNEYSPPWEGSMSLIDDGDLEGAIAAYDEGFDEGQADAISGKEKKKFYASKNAAGSVPVPFSGTEEEKRKNNATHNIDFSEEDARCMFCDCKMWHKAYDYPCGERVPRMDVAKRDVVAAYLASTGWNCKVCDYTNMDDYSRCINCSYGKKNMSDAEAEERKFDLNDGEW